jgi:hypothetical protein
MNLSRLVAELGPSMLKQHIADSKARGADVSFLEEHGDSLINAVSDAMLDNETRREDVGRAKFIAHLAADLLRGWPGEPSMHYEEAVGVAVKIVELSEKAATEHPSRA